MDEFSVCFSDPMIVDLDLFCLWLKGVSEGDSAKQLAISSSSVGDVPFPILLKEVNEQFSLFKFLQQYLQAPVSLSSQLLSSLSPHVKKQLIQSYYSFDKQVIREILGKRMSGKMRKDMDDVSEKTGVSLHSCRRQFDNIKNVWKSYDDLEGSIADIVHKNYLLDDSLARYYKAMVFIFMHRFETLKRRLLHLELDDFISCAEAMMELWTVTACNPHSRVTDLGLDVDDIDPTFIHEVRDVRNFLQEKEVMQLQNSLVPGLLESKSMTLHFTKSIDVNFKLLSRGILAVSASLSSSKEFKDFFVDVLDKLIDPIKQLNWTVKDADAFFTLYVEVWLELRKYNEFGGQQQRLDGAFRRYVGTIRRCIALLYK